MEVSKALELLKDNHKLTHKSWAEDESFRTCTHKTDGVAEITITKNGRNGDLNINLKGEDIELFFEGVGLVLPHEY
jgi:hypothetical protein